jgi:tagaturonate reductase
MQITNCKVGSVGSDSTMRDALNETVLQFGTGKFLRAFVDLFVHELNQQDSPLGRIVVVQSMGSERAGAFSDSAGRYRVALRGLRDGRPVDETVQVESVSRALTAADDWLQVLEVGRGGALKAIVSNVTEAGYALDPDEKSADSPPRSFPGKLLAVLRARFEARLPGVSILPCELLDDNARRLLELVVQTAQRWELSSNLIDWVRSECTWHNTLVDRIVSAPAPDDPLGADDPLFAVAEPFALWLVEGSPGPRELLNHPAVQQVDRLEPYHLRKVRILNGAHTALVAKALPAGFEIVRDAVLDPEIGSWLKRLLFDEIVPTLEDRTEDPKGFAQEVLERFANPFLDHRLADIALHQDVKIKTRLVPTYEDFRRKFGRAPELLGEILR